MWLPDMDLNHDKQIQSLLCYRYTIGQTSVIKVECSIMESRLVEMLSCGTCGAGAAPTPRSWLGSEALTGGRGSRAPMR